MSFLRSLMKEMTPIAVSNGGDWYRLPLWSPVTVAACFYAEVFLESVQSQVSILELSIESNSQFNRTF